MKYYIFFFTKTFSIILTKCRCKQCYKATPIVPAIICSYDNRPTDRAGVETAGKINLVNLDIICSAVNLLEHDVPANLR